MKTETRWQKFRNNLFKTVSEQPKPPCMGCGHFSRCAQGKSCEAFYQYVEFGRWGPAAKRYPSTGRFQIIFREVA